VQKATRCLSGHWLGSLQVLRIKQRLLILQPSLIRFCICICNSWFVISKLLSFPEMGWSLYSKLFPFCEGFKKNFFFTLSMFCDSSGILQGGCRGAWSGAWGKYNMSKHCRITLSLPPRHIFGLLGVYDYCFFWLFDCLVFKAVCL